MERGGGAEGGEDLPLLAYRSFPPPFDAAADSSSSRADNSDGGNNGGQTIAYKVEASMLEIYNERVRDLFVPLHNQERSGLKIRDSPKTGATWRGLRGSRS